MKLISTCIILAASVIAASAQVTTGRLEGTVTDSQGAGVPAAQIKVVSNQNGQTLALTADEKGFWSLPSLSSGTYTVTVNHPGFKIETVENVKIDAGVPATVNTVLQVGSLSETVEVTAGAEVLQT